MADGIPLFTPLADRLEDLLVGRFRGPYRRVVQGLTVLALALVVVSGVLFLTDQAGLDGGAYGPVLAVTGVVVSLFVLLGVLQFLLLARAVDRTAAEVTEAADEVATGAKEVVEAAATVETGAEAVETAAQDVETAAQNGEAGAEAAHQRGESAKESAEQAREAGEEAKEVASDARERLGAPEDGEDEAEGA